MATQRVLQTYDLLELIFASFRISTDVDERSFGIDGSHKRDLARAARVCKAFFPPAVKLLWERMDDLFPLFKLFEGLRLIAGGVSERRSSHGKELVYHLCNPISTQEWTRYKLYSQCIKSTSFAPWSQRWTVHWSVLECMSKTNGGAPLLPVLRHLEWEQTSPMDDSVNKFISSTVQVFKFSYCGLRGLNSTTLMEFYMPLLFHELSVKAHSLEQLTIDGIHHFSSTLSFSVCKFNKLCKIHLTIRSELDPAVLPMLASFESLTDLSLVNFELSQPTSLVQLAALKHLYLRSDENSLTDFLESVQLPGLQSMKVAVLWVDDFDTSYALLTSIADCCAETLLMLEIYSPACTSPGPGGTFITLVEPLFRMRHLRSVTIDLYGPFTPSDQDMQELAEAWPDLLAIDLLYDSGEPQELPHLYSLVHFAMLCPELRSIRIAPVSTVPLPDLEPYPILSHGLQLISFHHPSRPPITDPRGVALFLDSIFPNIDVAECQRLFEEVFAEGWQEVLTNLSDFQRVRNQQDIRAGRA